MTVTLDAATEARIQHEIERGNCRDAAEFVAHAVSLLATENDFLLLDKQALLERLDESAAQIERGEGISGEKVRETVARQLADWRLSRAG